MNNIRPFRFWCQKVLPLVYDDSLSYYELLCKVVAKLNEVVDNENQLNEAFQQLKDWVENYFDSHDFQEMVNDKLDSMVEDGTLGSLINDKLLGDINAKVDNNTNDISEMKPKVEQLETNVANNTSSINNHSQRITALEGWSLKGKQIDWFGDSIIQGEEPGGTHTYVDKPIPTLFAEATGATCINHAQSGATLADNVWETKVINQVNSADLTNCDYAIVQGGINDYVLNYPVGTNTLTGSLVEGLYKILNAIADKNEHIKIIVLSMFPNNALYNGSLGHDGANFINYNDGIKQLCKDRGIRCIDMTYNSINRRTFASVSSDGTHFNQLGYQLLTDSLINAIETAGTALPLSSGNNLISGLFPTADLTGTDETNANTAITGNTVLLKPGNIAYSAVAMRMSAGTYTVRMRVRVKNGTANIYFGCETYQRLGGITNVPGSSGITFRYYEITINPTSFNNRLCILLSEDSTCEYALITDITLCEGEIPCKGDTMYDNRANVSLNGSFFNIEYPLQFKQRDRFISFNGPVQTTAIVPARTTLVDLSNYNFAKGRYCPNSAVILAAGLDGNVYPLLLDLNTSILENLKQIPANTNLGITAVIDIC